MKVKGHAIKSFRNNDEGSEKRQQQPLNIINKTPRSAFSSSSPIVYQLMFFPSTPSTQSGKVTKFHNCQVTFKVVQGQCSSVK